MGTSHDLRQDDRLDVLEARTSELRKHINANIRKIKQIADELNARLDALDPQSGHSHQVKKPQPSRRKPAPKGAKK